MWRPVGIPEVEQRADQFADGTELEYTIRTDDSAVYHLFTADLGRRLRSAQLHVSPSERGRTFERFHAFAPASETGRTSTVYDLPAGEVTVSIDASEPDSHGYLRYHVESAVAYTRALDVDVERASVIAGALLGLATVLLIAGQPFLAAPAVGAGAAMGAPVGVNWLAARGHPISVSRWDVPVHR